MSAKVFWLAVVTAILVFPLIYFVGNRTSKVNATAIRIIKNDSACKKLLGENITCSLLVFSDRIKRNNIDVLSYSGNVSGVYGTAEYLVEVERVDKTWTNMMVVFTKDDTDIILRDSGDSLEK